jgi:hypothetical protein
MAEMEMGVFPILDEQEKIFAITYAQTQDPVLSLKAAGILDECDDRQRKLARQYLANPAIQKVILDEVKRIYRVKRYDKNYIVENAAKVAEYCLEIDELIIPGKGKGEKKAPDVTIKKMKNTSDALKALDLLAKIQALYDPLRDGSIKQLAAINIQLSNTEEKRI